MAEDGGETRGGRGGKAERGSHGDEKNTHAENEGVQKKAEERTNGGGGGLIIGIITWQCRNRDGSGGNSVCK